MDTLFGPDTKPTGDPLARVPSELAKRDAVLSAHEDNYRGVLVELRHLLRLRYKWLKHQFGDAAFVTADDAREFLRFNPVFAGRTFASMNWLGQLFRDGEREKTGDRITSKTPGSHGNDLLCWRLRSNT